jgi:hypothetical protein
MHSTRMLVLALSVSFCPACGGCGHDKVVIKDERKPAPPPTVVVQQPAPAATPAPTVNVNK